MDSARATGLFAVSFVVAATIDILETTRTRPAVWVSLVLLTIISSMAFGLASRRATYRWYSPVVAGVFTLYMEIGLHRFAIDIGRVTAWISILVVLVFAPVLFARVFAEQRPPDPAPTDR
jgi:hypothetical protein